MPLHHWLPLLLACPLTYLLARAYEALARRQAILAEPNHRSAHTIPTPTGGGLVFLLPTFLGAGYLWSVQMIEPTQILLFIGPALVGCCGFLDDNRQLTVGFRLPIFVCAAALSVSLTGFPVLDLMGLQIDLQWAGLIFGAVSLFWLQNLYNFMDGIDGIAAMEASFVFGAACLLGYQEGGVVSPLLLLLCMIALGFLIINWPDARVFMGDAGSGFLGLCLGIFALAESGVNVWVWMILLSYFIADATVTILGRLVRKQRIWEAHSSHAYQHMNRQYGKRRALMAVIIINLLWLFPLAWVANWLTEFAPLLLVLALVPLSLFVSQQGAGRQASSRVSG